MIAETNYSVKRLKNIFIMFVFTMILSISLNFWYKFYIDQLISTVFIGVLFFLLYVLCLETCRTNNLISSNISTGYSEIRNFYCIYCVLFFLFTFLPEFTCPVFLMAVLFTVISNYIVSLTVCIYLEAIICLTVHADFYEFCAYLFLTLFGCILTFYLKKSNYRKFVYFIIIALSISIPLIFHFLASFTFSKEILIYGLCIGIITDLVFFLFFDKIDYYSKNQKSRNIDEILKDTYPLILDLKAASEKEFSHAKKVSDLCGACAPIIGVDEKAARAAGLYYRIGKLEQSQNVASCSTQIAQIHLFPNEITSVLHEYNAELQNPSSKLSAMVHLINALVTKFEILDKDTLNSTWNHDVVVYQLFNEISSSGIYDESGLTMNQYIKIRDFFVKGNKII